MRMTRIEMVMCLLLGVFCLNQISSAAPVSDGNSNVVDEILMRLKQLKQQKKKKKGVQIFLEVI